MATKTKAKPKHRRLPKNRAAARVAVAKDVIERIQRRRLHVSGGQYMDVPDHISQSKIRKTVASLESNCEVCALGACFLSFVRLYNKFDLKPIIGDIKEGRGTSVEDFRGALSRAFDNVQMDLIESAFERRPRPVSADSKERKAVCPAGYEAYLDWLNHASQFGQEFDGDEGRLLAIMQNVIDHKGEFRPEVEYEIVEG